MPQDGRPTIPPQARFGGFPKGESETVLVPARFFNDLLPRIDDLAELKVTLYAFYALQQREGMFRYLRLRDLLADAVLMAGIGGETELRAGLERAEQRGTLLSVALPGGAQPAETIYFINTERGRRALEALQRGDWLPGQGDHLVGLIADRPNIFTLYEQNIGALTPLIAETLRDAEKTYPYEWITEAMRIAVELNKRSWRYVEAVLKRWTLEGKPDMRKPADQPDTDPYLQDEYFRRRDGQT